MRNASQLVRHEKRRKGYSPPKQRLRTSIGPDTGYRVGHGTVTHDNKISPGAERLSFEILAIFESLP